MKRVCRTCEFFDLQVDPAGLCRCGLPAKSTPSWPTVQKADWCGQYQPSEEDGRLAALRSAKRILSDSVAYFDARLPILIPQTFWLWFPDELSAHCASLGYPNIKVAGADQGMVAILKA